MRFAVRIAGLDHELFDNPVEQRTVIYSLFYQFDKVITMFRCFIIQGHCDIPHGGFQFH